MTRTICVVTGARADYWLLRGLMQAIAASPQLRLQVVATGMHLAPEYGLTVDEIERDGFAVRRVDMLLSSDTAVGVTKSMGLGFIGFADALHELAPDVLVLLGDRFELLPAAAAALIAGIPVAHIHGGETTEGAFDEAIRHAITKMSHLHFVAAEPYRARVIQLGEDPARVFHVGGLGVDNVSRTERIARETLEAELDFRLGPRNLLVTFHPVTLEPGTSAAQLRELLAALSDLRETHLLFTKPNADTEGRELSRLIDEFVSAHPHARAYDALGERRYFACMSYVDGVVGNSSSGLLEAPSFGIGTVNIGTRQRGRLRAESVIDCEPTRASISAAIDTLYSPRFRERARQVRNPYGDGGATARILAVLASHPLEGLTKKSFHDMEAV